SFPVHHRLGSSALGGNRKLRDNRPHHRYWHGVPIRKIWAVARFQFLPRIIRAVAPLALRKVLIEGWERRSHNQVHHYTAWRPSDARKLAPVCAALNLGCRCKI